jgi:hypothetical protein
MDQDDERSVADDDFYHDISGRTVSCPLAAAERVAVPLGALVWLAR